MSRGARYVREMRSVTAGFDLRNARAGFERGLAAASRRIGDEFANAVGRASNGRLERLLRTPARSVVLNVIFSQMPRYFDRLAAADLDATVRWRITGRNDGRADVWDVLISGGRCRAVRGETQRDPRLTITAEAAEFVRLVTGNSDPMRAYFGGRIELAGDVMLAARLQSVFHLPGSPRPGQPQ